VLYLEMGIEPKTPNSNPVLGLSKPNQMNPTVNPFELNPNFVARVRFR